MMIGNCNQKNADECASGACVHYAVRTATD